MKLELGAGVKVRAAREADLEAVLALDRSAAEAPHWSAAVYAEAIADNGLDVARWARGGGAAGGGAERPGRVRRLLVATVPRDDGEVELAGFAVGQVVGMGGRPAELGSASGSVSGFVGESAAEFAAESAGEIESVAVAAEQRRRGMGRALCVRLLAWFRQAGATGVELEVRASSAGAIALYRSLGFWEQGRRRGYYADPGDDAVLMRLDL